MSFFKWNSKRARLASEREQEALLETSPDDEIPAETNLHFYRQMDAGQTNADTTFYPYHHTPYGYYRFTPQYFGSLPQAPPPNRPNAPVHPSQSKGSLNKSQKPSVDMSGNQERPVMAHSYPPQQPYGYPTYPYPYSYPGPYGYPNPYGYGRENPGVVCNPAGAVERPPREEREETESSKTGLMSTVEGRRPLFLVALFIVSIAVLLVSFPLTLLSAGYIGPLGLMFATGPFATVFAFWAIYLTPCECYPNIEWAVSRIRVFATTAAVFDAVGTIGVPISMYGAQCPDDDDTMLGCEDELPAAKGVSLAVAVVLGTHCFLCLLVRSNARKLAESKYGDDRTEGITLTPTPFRP